jgi:hypothetical protein
MIASAEGAMILLLGGYIAKAIFRMSDSIREMTKTLGEFVKKDECKADMGSHCSKMESLDCRLTRQETAFAELAAKAELWHKE